MYMCFKYPSTKFCEISSSGSWEPNRRVDDYPPTTNCHMPEKRISWPGQHFKPQVVSTLKTQIVWDITPCGLVNKLPTFQRIVMPSYSQPDNARKWKHRVPSKRRWVFTNRRDELSQDTRIFGNTLRTSDFAWFCTYFSFWYPACRSQWPRGLRRRSWPLSCWDCGFESHRWHGCLSVVSVVCCQVEVSATSWSLVQRSPTDCGVSLCVI